MAQERVRDQAGIAGEWPLVGRDRDMHRICQRLIGPQARGVVLAGASGVGKTRLVDACLKRMPASFAVARVTGTHAASRLPFGALAPLLPPISVDDGYRAEDRSEFLRRSASAMVASAGNRRMLLVIDDIHLLDETSAILVHQLVSARSCTVLAVLRAGEQAPDPVVALWKDNLLPRLELDGLDSDCVEEALARALGGDIDRAAVDAFASRCQGNMLFLRELVLSAIADGSLDNESGIWRLAAATVPSIRLIELVEARLSGLDDAQRAALEVVSIGEPLGPAELDALTDASVAERLERLGLLMTSTNGRRLEVRLAHPIYGEVLRARIPRLRGRSIARSLADVVEATGARRREDTLRVASWRLEGGGARPELMLAGATEARWHYDFKLAERLVRASLAAGAGFEAALLAAQLAMLQGRSDEAERDLADLAAAAENDQQRGRVASARLDNAGFFQGRVTETLAIADEADESITDPTWRAEIRAKRAGVLLGTQGPRAGAEAAQAVMASGEGRVVTWAALIACRSLVRLGRFEAAFEAADRGAAADMTLLQPVDWYPWMHIQFRCDALTLSGRVEEGETLAELQYKESLAERSVEKQAFFAWALCKSALARGRVHTAARYGNEAAALYHELGRSLMEYFCIPYLAQALAHSARVEEATVALARLDALGLPEMYYTGVDAIEARAWVCVATGDLPGGRTILSRAADVGEETGDTVGAVVALHGLARLGQARVVLDRLTRLAATVEGELAAARVRHTAALAKNDADELSRASATFEAMGVHLLAAEAASDAAVICRRLGRHRDAAASERRAGTLADRCEGAVTPALQNVEGRAQLTASERDVAILAASGNTSRAIAEQLSLSIRTVETYLQRSYEKLGVSRRTQLAEALQSSETGADK